MGISNKVVSVWSQKVGVPELVKTQSALNREIRNRSCLSRGKSKTIGIHDDLKVPSWIKKVKYQGQIRLEIVWVIVRAYSVAALYWHSLDGATVYAATNVPRFVLDIGACYLLTKHCCTVCMFSSSVSLGHNHNAVIVITIQLRFDGRSTADQRSLGSQWRDPLAAATLTYLLL